MAKFPKNIRNKALHLLYRIQGKRVLHFLHLGKTGGTAVKHALMQVPPGRRYVLYLHSHNVILEDIAKGEGVFFCVRNPTARFISGFYSRQRQGQPRHFSPWSPEEKSAFEFFSTPNQLGKALSSQDLALKQRAINAMKNIKHINSSYWDWFKDEDYLRSRQSDIFFIGFQEQLTENFEILKKRLGFPEIIELPKDDFHAHRNPIHLDKSLEAQAVKNIRDWYQDDYRFIELCREIVNQQKAGKKIIR